MSEFPQHNGRRQHGHGPGHELVAAAGTGRTRLGLEVRLGQQRSVTECHRTQSREPAKETEPGDLISSEWGESNYPSHQRTKPQ